MKRIKKNAIKVMEANKLSEIFVNKKGELFSDENRAINSVSGKKEEIEKHRLSDLKREISEHKAVENTETEIKKVENKEDKSSETVNK